LSQRSNLILALDLGGTHFRLALADENGKVLKHHVGLTNAEDGPEQGISRIKDAIRGMLSGTSPDAVRGMGVAAAGLIDRDAGMLLTSPNMLSWYKTPLKELFEQELELPVWVGNDANLAALGEHMFGAGRDSDDLIYITVSTGIGGGVVSGGRLLTGYKGFAIEPGHMTIDINGPRCNCGNVGCLEVMASGTAIARMAVDKLSGGEKSAITGLVDGDLDRVTAEVVAGAAKTGDVLAKEVMHTAATNLGVGVVNLVHLFNPELVIIGGGVSKAGDLIFEPVRRVVAERIMPDIEVRILPAYLGDDSGLLGAVALVLQSAP